MHDVARSVFGVLIRRDVDGVPGEPYLQPTDRGVGRAL